MLKWDFGILLKSCEYSQVEFNCNGLDKKEDTVFEKTLRAILQSRQAVGFELDRHNPKRIEVSAYGQFDDKHHYRPPTLHAFGDTVAEALTALAKQILNEAHAKAAQAPTILDSLAEEAVDD